MRLDPWPPDMLVAAHPALDFLNTAGGSDKSRDPERLTDWHEVVRFARAADLVDAAEARRLIEDADSPDATVALAKLVALREELLAELRTLAGAPYIPGLALPALSRRLATAMRDATLRGRGNRLVWDVDVKTAGHELIAARVLLATEDLLTSDDIRRLRECGRCSWLFLDKSRGRGRRWCRMDVCGNRNKAARHRARHAS
jgi:predicted RNA-binding Zn ribbon-like protein